MSYTPSPETLAYDALAGSCDCYGDDPCEDCKEAVEWFIRGYNKGRLSGLQAAIDIVKGWENFDGELVLITEKLKMEMEK